MHAAIPQQQANISGAGFANFPVLASLRLEEKDLAALAHQGFIATERRGTKTYYKLRFRVSGKQRVRTISGSERAEALQLELNVVQHGRNLRRRKGELLRKASSICRSARFQMQTMVEAKDFYFHGYTMRKRRSKE